MGSLFIHDDALAANLILSDHTQIANLELHRESIPDLMAVVYSLMPPMGVERRETPVCVQVTVGPKLGYKIWVKVINISVKFGDLSVIAKIDRISLKSLQIPDREVFIGIRYGRQRNHGSMIMPQEIWKRIEDGAQEQRDNVPLVRV